MAYHSCCVTPSSQGITHLQYTNDMIILVELNDACLANLKFILLCFEALSGLKINFSKSEVTVTRLMRRRLLGSHGFSIVRLVLFPSSTWACLPHPLMIMLRNSNPSRPRAAIELCLGTVDIIQKRGKCVSLMRAYLPCLYSLWASSCYLWALTLASIKAGGFLLEFFGEQTKIQAR